MLLSNRRKLMLGAVVLFTSACKFTPVYGPDAAGSKLDGRISVSAPSTREQYLLTRRLETRLGRSDPAPMTLTYSVSHSASGLGTTATGSTTRLHRVGALSYSLKNTSTGEMIDKGRLTNFTGYSATGNTAASLAAESAAIERLMYILADQLVDRLHLIDPALLP
ncbi:LPS assembly lipoprotein LptE [Planktotalea sp.]|uniref:LPS assembly lipoprotein LptE n=1 Tax=Planktotalea sp. TaxID=2029877 RepID=UPI0025E5EFBA|nr:LPS assembly lipoprotein LptE [Planktotalea sp.]